MQAITLSSACPRANLSMSPDARAAQPGSANREMCPVWEGSWGALLPGLHPDQTGATRARIGGNDDCSNGEVWYRLARQGVVPGGVGVRELADQLELQQPARGTPMSRVRGRCRYPAGSHSGGSAGKSRSLPGDLLLYERTRFGNLIGRERRVTLPCFDLWSCWNVTAAALVSSGFCSAHELRRRGSMSANKKRVMTLGRLGMFDGVHESPTGGDQAAARTSAMRVKARAADWRRYDTGQVAAPGDARPAA